MKRRALIISYPGELGASNFCAGVNVDVEHYQSFLTNPLGGAWNRSEILHLPSPTKANARNAVKELEDVDYSMVIYTGHGFHSSETDSTNVELNRLESLDSDELRKGGQKRTIILDCCRKTYPELVQEELRKFAFANESTEVNAIACRNCYDQKLSETSAGIVVIHSCDVDEVSGDSSRVGGYYSSSLLKACEQWKPVNLDLKTHFRVKTVVQAHEMSLDRVRKISGGGQHPQIEKPRSEPYFPFAIWA